jgi:hypothetical protein
MIEGLGSAATLTWLKIKRKLLHALTNVDFALASGWRLIYAKADFYIIQVAKKKRLIALYRKTKKCRSNPGALDTGAPIILCRCPSLSAHESESMLQTYLVCREKQKRERERETSRL